MRRRRREEEHAQKEDPLKIVREQKSQRFTFEDRRLRVYVHCCNSVLWILQLKGTATDLKETGCPVLAKGMRHGRTNAKGAQVAGGVEVILFVT